MLDLPFDGLLSLPLSLCSIEVHPFVPIKLGATRDAQRGSKMAALCGHRQSRLVLEAREHRAIIELGGAVMACPHTDFAGGAERVTSFAMAHTKPESSRAIATITTVFNLPRRMSWR